MPLESLRVHLETKPFTVRCRHGEWVCIIPDLLRVLMQGSTAC